MKMTSPWFYHLDTCFCPLSNGDYLIYPEAFETLEHASKYSGRFIVVDEHDAEQFACNAVCVENNIIMPNCSDELVHNLEKRGYNVYLLDFSEFLKSGGAAKCLTLRIS
jgi:N-dimethylarginine dimethylaminohydrolase